MKRIAPFLFCTVGLFGSGVSEIPDDSSFHTFVAADYLYWKYTSPSLVFGRDGVGTDLANVTQAGTSFSPDYKFQSGFRAALGFMFGEDKAFDTILRYTWFYANPEKSVDQFSFSFLPIGWLTGPTSGIHKASLAVAIHIQYPEVQLGYTFKVNRFLALRSYMAISSIIVAGELHAEYDYATSTAKTFGHTSSWSVGPKLGLDFTVRPIANLAAYCGINLTQQNVQMFMHTKQTNYGTPGGPYVLQEGQLSQIRSVPLFGFEIGPVWDQWFYNKKYHFQIKAVWQTSTIGGANLSFLNNNNVDIPIGAELRGFNIRALFEF